MNYKHTHTVLLRHNRPSEIENRVAAATEVVPRMVKVRTIMNANAITLVLWLVSSIVVQVGASGAELRKRREGGKRREHSAHIDLAVNTIPSYHSTANIQWSVNEAKGLSIDMAIPDDGKAGDVKICDNDVVKLEKAEALVYHTGFDFQSDVYPSIEQADMLNGLTLSLRNRLFRYVSNMAVALAEHTLIGMLGIPPIHIVQSIPAIGPVDLDVTNVEFESLEIRDITTSVTRNEVVQIRIGTIRTESDDQRRH